MGRFDNLIEKIKTIDTESINNWSTDNTPTSEIVEKQKIYVWIRLYLKEELSDIEIGDDITMWYKPSDEKLLTKFICFDKTSLTKDHDDLDKIINFNTEDDKKVLCLMVDEEVINEGKDIPLLKTLFRNCKHYQFQLLKRDELVYVNSRTGEVLDYFDCDY